jgi:hypothetical protein
VLVQVEVSLSNVSRHHPPLHPSLLLVSFTGFLFLLDLILSKPDVTVLCTSKWRVPETSLPEGPDVVLLEASNPRSPTRAGRLLSVSELGTFWTLPLEEYPVTSSLFERLNLEHHISKCHCFGQGEL